MHPPPSPFFPPKEFDKLDPLIEEKPERRMFTREVRNPQQQSDGAEDYYNDWIMSNVGK